MLSNYFKIAWRNLVRNRFVSLVNILGLGIGLAVAFIIMAWVADEVSYDKFHKNLPHIYGIMQNMEQGGDIYTVKSVSGPLAAAVRSEVPEVKYAARVTNTGQQLIAYMDKAIYEETIYAEPDYFRIMTFPAIAGNAVVALNTPNTIILTEKTAKKLFDGENPIGKIVTWNNQHSIAVGAVIKDIPSNSSYTFSAVLPFTLFEKENSASLAGWNNNFINTWVQLQPSANVQQVNAKLSTLVRTRADNKKADFFAYPLAEMAMHNKFKNGKPAGGRMEMLMMMSILGLFVLVIACVNFMNLSTARSERRAKEVGIRKTAGASRTSLVWQFLTEAVLVTFLSLIAAVTAAKLLLPAFNNLTGKNATLDFGNWKIPVALLATAFVTAVISGAYPAFFLSRFQPVKVLKDTASPKQGRSLLRKGLVTFQFVISSFLIITTLVIYRQVQFGQQFPAGYELQGLVEIPARGDIGNKFQLFRNTLLQQPGVQAVTASSDNIVNINTSTNGLSWPGKTSDQDFPVYTTNVQYDWAKTTGIAMLDGRDFSRAYGNDSLTCILNRAAVKRMGLQQPVVGKMIGSHRVIGVAKDFVYNDVFAAPTPLVAFLDTGKLSHILVRINKQANRQQTLEGIQAAFKQAAPGYPFVYKFTEEMYDNKFTGIRSGGAFSSMVGVLAIIISCMGLLALSMFIAERRTKEIGIRKILGASSSTIWLSLSKDFLSPVFLAFAITVPLAGFVMQKMLASMEHHIQLSGWLFATAGAMVTLLALLIVSFQAIKAAIANPVKSLRTE